MQNLRNRLQHRIAEGRKHDLHSHCPYEDRVDLFLRQRHPSCYISGVIVGRSRRGSGNCGGRGQGSHDKKIGENRSVQPREGEVLAREGGEGSDEEGQGFKLEPSWIRQLNAHSPAAKQ